MLVGGWLGGVVFPRVCERELCCSSLAVVLCGHVWGCYSIIILIVLILLPSVVLNCTSSYGCSYRGGVLYGRTRDALARVDVT